MITSLYFYTVLTFYSKLLFSTGERNLSLRASLAGQKGELACGLTHSNEFTDLRIAGKQATFFTMHDKGVACVKYLGCVTCLFLGAIFLILNQT